MGRRRSTLIRKTHPARWVASLLLAQAASTHPAVTRWEFVYVAQPIKAARSPSIEETPAGLIVRWIGDGQPMISRAIAGKWTPPARDSIAPFRKPAILVHDAGVRQRFIPSDSGFLYEAWSRDSGATWSPPRKTQFPNPGSPVAAVTARDGRHLLIYVVRSQIFVAVSKEGREWRRVMELETEPGRYAEPDAILGRDGLVHLTYTWNGHHVMYVALDPSRLP